MAHALGPGARTNPIIKALKRKRPPRADVFDVPGQPEIEIAQNHGFESGVLPRRTRRKLEHRGVLDPEGFEGLSQLSRGEDAPQEEGQLENVDNATAASGASGDKWTESEDRLLQRALDKGKSPKDITATIFPDRGYSTIRKRIAFLKGKALAARPRHNSPIVQVSPPAQVPATQSTSRTAPSGTPSATDDDSAPRAIAGEKWTAEEDRILRRALRRGKTSAEITALLPDRGRSAVSNRAATLQEQVPYLKSRDPIHLAGSTNTAPTSLRRTLWRDTQENELAMRHTPPSAEVLPTEEVESDRNEQRTSPEARKWDAAEEKIILLALAEGKESSEIAETAEVDFPGRSFDDIRARVRFIQSKYLREMLAPRTPARQTSALPTVPSSSRAFPSSASHRQDLWTPADDQILRREIAKGKGPKEILEDNFPTRHYEAVRGRIRRIRLGKPLTESTKMYPAKWTAEEDRILLDAHSEEISYADIVNDYLPHRTTEGVRKRLKRINGDQAPSSSQFQPTSSPRSRSASRQPPTKWNADEDRILREEATKNRPLAETARIYFPTRTYDAVQKRRSFLHRPDKANLNSLTLASTPAPSRAVSTPASASRRLRPTALSEALVRDSNSPEPTASAALAKIRQRREAKRRAASQPVSSADASQQQLTILPSGKLQLKPSSRSTSQNSAKSQSEGEEEDEGHGENDEAYHSQSSATKQFRAEQGSIIVQPPTGPSNSMVSADAKSRTDDVKDDFEDVNHDTISDDSEDVMDEIEDVDHDPISDDSDADVYDAKPIFDDELIPSSPPVATPSAQNHPPVQALQDVPERQNAQKRSPPVRVSRSPQLLDIQTPKAPDASTSTFKPKTTIGPTRSGYTPLFSAKRQALLDAESDGSTSESGSDDDSGDEAVSKKISSKEKSPAKHSAPPTFRPVSTASTRVISNSAAVMEEETGSGEADIHESESEDGEPNESDSEKDNDKDESVDNEPIQVEEKSSSPRLRYPSPSQQLLENLSRAETPSSKTAAPMASTPRYTPIFSAARLARLEADDEGDDSSTESSSSGESDPEPLAKTVAALKSAQAQRKLQEPPRTATVEPKVTTSFVAERDKSREAVSVGSTPNVKERYFPKQVNLAIAVDHVIAADHMLNEAQEAVASLPNSPSNVSEAADSDSSEEDGNSEEDETSEVESSADESEDDSEDDQPSDKMELQGMSSNPAKIKQSSEEEWGGLSDEEDVLPLPVRAAERVDDVNDGNTEDNSSSEEEDEDEDEDESSSSGESSSSEDDSSGDEDSSSDNESADEGDEDIEMIDASTKSQPTPIESKLAAIQKNEIAPSQKSKPAPGQKTRPANILTKQPVAIKTTKPLASPKKLPATTQKNKSAVVRNSKPTVVHKDTNAGWTDQQEEIARLLEETAGLKSQHATQSHEVTPEVVKDIVETVVEDRVDAEMKEGLDDGMDEEMDEGNDEEVSDLEAETTRLMDRMRKRMRTIFPLF
jgi:hypothetical protein